MEIHTLALFSLKDNLFSHTKCFTDLLIEKSIRPNAVSRLFDLLFNREMQKKKRYHMLFAVTLFQLKEFEKEMNSFKKGFYSSLNTNEKQLFNTLSEYYSILIDVESSHLENEKLSTLTKHSLELSQQMEIYDKKLHLLKNTEIQLNQTIDMLIKSIEVAEKAPRLLTTKELAENLNRHIKLKTPTP